VEQCKVYAGEQGDVYDISARCDEIVEECFSSDERYWCMREAVMTQVYEMRMKHCDSIASSNYGAFNLKDYSCQSIAMKCGKTDSWCVENEVKLLRKEQCLELTGELCVDPDCSDDQVLVAGKCVDLEDSIEGGDDNDDAGKIHQTKTLGSKPSVGVIFGYAVAGIVIIAPGTAITYVGGSLLFGGLGGVPIKNEIPPGVVLRPWGDQGEFIAQYDPRLISGQGVTDYFAGTGLEGLRMFPWRWGQIQDVQIRSLRLLERAENSEDFWLEP
jgi:hypothetical protein